VAAEFRSSMATSKTRYLRHLVRVVFGGCGLFLLVPALAFAVLALPPWEVRRIVAPLWRVPASSLLYGDSVSREAGVETGPGSPLDQVDSSSPFDPGDLGGRIAGRLTRQTERRAQIRSAQVGRQAPAEPLWGESAPGATVVQPSASEDDSAPPALLGSSVDPSAAPDDGHQGNGNGGGYDNGGENGTGGGQDEGQGNGQGNGGGQDNGNGGQGNGGQDEAGQDGGQGNGGGQVNGRVNGNGNGR
jgi:hypothetical protein